MIPRRVQGFRCQCGNEELDSLPLCSSEAIEGRVLLDCPACHRRWWDRNGAKGVG